MNGNGEFWSEGEQHRSLRDEAKRRSEHGLERLVRAKLHHQCAKRNPALAH
jgi:hypothetical protein